MQWGVALHPPASSLCPPRPRDPAPARSRRCSGDSDSSASSAQSGPPGPRDGGTPRRRDPSRGVPPQPPRDTGASPGGRAAPEERGRSRVPNGPSRASPRAHSHGRPGPQPLLLISRQRDGQHSWARAEPPSRPGSPARSRTPSRPAARSPAPTPRRSSLEEGAGGRRAGVPGEGPHGGEAGEALQRELEELARRLRAPLRLEPSQEQQLFRRLEEEFLANTRMMEELEDGETPSLPPPPPPGTAADSAYCSSSSSSSSLNVFGKHGLPAEDGRRSGNGPPLPVAPEMADAGRRPALSSSSDESSCFPASWDTREMRGGPESDTDWAPGEDELTETEETPATADGPPGLPGVPEPVPSLPSPPPRPWAKPRLDTQPHKKPSRIPTPRGYGAAPPQPPTGSPKPWGALQSVLSSFLEPPWVLREHEGLEEDAWP